MGDVLMPKSIAAILSLIKAIESIQDASKLQRYLENCNIADLVKWTDDENQDVLHYVIIANNYEALKLLFSKNLFTPPHEPLTSPYLHLASALGHRTLISLLVEFRYHDYRPSRLPVFIPDKVEDKTTSYQNTNFRKTPLDYAANGEHINCVKLLLDLVIVKQHPKMATSGYLALACVARSPSAVKLILSERSSKSDVTKAVDVAMKNFLPQCLDLLLSSQIETKTMFRGVNFYHMLFAHSTCCSEESYAQVPLMTSTLIKHGHDVNAKLPFRTFPIYTLIASSFCYHEYLNTKHYMKSLQLLLNAGADPYFDEVRFEKQSERRPTTKSLMIERAAYTSAVHCLMETVETHATFLASKALAVRYIIEVADILLRHGPKGESSTHQTISSSIMHQYAMSGVKIGVDRDVVKILFRHGADPDAVINGTYAINIFCAAVMSLDCSKNISITIDDVDAALSMIGRMSYQALYAAWTVYKKSYKKARNDEINLYLSHISQELKHMSSNPKSLKLTCSIFIWNQCNRKASNIYRLPIAVGLKAEIVPSL